MQYWDAGVSEQSAYSYSLSLSEFVAGAARSNDTRPTSTREQTRMDH
jgi:hypothetical protein